MATVVPPKSLPPEITPPPDHKTELVKSLVEFDLGLHIILAGFMLFIVIAIFAFRFDLINIMGKDSSVFSTKAVSSAVPTPKPPKVIEYSIEPAPFINKHTISIDKAFKNQSDKVYITTSGQLKREVFGYLPYWVLDKADDINLRALTSVSYFGLEVGSDGEIITYSDDKVVLGGWQGWNDTKLQDFFTKAKKSRIKALVTLKAFDNQNIEKLVKSKEASKKFVKNALFLVNSRSLDGINVDFEYIGTPPGEVKEGFSILMADLNKELKRQYPKSVLSVSTFVTAASTDKLHDVELLAKHSDYLVVMGYDFSTPNSLFAGAVAPMDGYGYSLKSMVGSYLEKVPAEKLVLAVPYYGYDWAVESGDKNAKVLEAGEAKVYTYAEAIDGSTGIKINWDENSLTPWYTYLDPTSKQTRVVHFENTRSLGVKYDYINQKDLKGVGIWALGFDGTSFDLVKLLIDKFSK